MRNLNEANLTDAVLAKLEHAGDARSKEIMESLVWHLHAFVRETELTEAEWFAGIQVQWPGGNESYACGKFTTAADGRMCTRSFPRRGTRRWRPTCSWQATRIWIPTPFPA